MKNVLSKLLMLILFSSIICLTSCKKDAQNYDHEDTITTLLITFTPQPLVPVKSGTVIESTIFKYFILEGEEPEITFTGPNLTQNVFYNYSIEILNEEDEGNIEDLTGEIEDEADDHLFCITGGTVSEQNKDTKGKDFGSQGVITFTTAGAKTTTIRLKHEPNKDAGNPCSTGDTDIEATFNHTVDLLL
jgi:hypothetical protein